MKGPRPGSARHQWVLWVAAATVMVGIGLVILGNGRDTGTAPVPVTGGNFQVSGIAHVPGSRQFLFVDDDSPDAVFALELDPTGRQRGAAVRIPLATRVTDPEAMTWDGRYFYIVGSQSKLTGFDGDGLVRFQYDTGSRRAYRVERIQALKAWLAEHVIELRGVDRQVGDHVLNIEGLAWDKAERRFLLGLRAPVVDGSALVIPVRLEPADGPFVRENLRVAGETIRLPLAGAGIRSIEFDELSGRFQIITGAELNEETLDFIVMEWDGKPGSQPVTIARFDRTLKPEGFATAMGTTGSMRVLVFDTGRLLVVK